MERHKCIIEIIKSLKGPFSLLYYDKVTANIYFTRDKIGRNSLLFHENNNSIVISSLLGKNFFLISEHFILQLGFILKEKNTYTMIVLYYFYFKIKYIKI